MRFPIHPVRVGATAAALAVVVALGASCSGGGGDDAKAAPAGGSITLTAGPVTVASAGPQVTVDDALRDQLLGTATSYVQAATIAPLRTGKAARDLAAVFTAPVAARLGGPDRAVLADDGFPAATRRVAATAAPVPVTVLVDGSGTPILATTGLDLTVNTATAKGPVTIHRIGSLTLAPDAGTWKVAGYDLNVGRRGAGVDAAARAGTATSDSTGGGS